MKNLQSTVNQSQMKMKFRFLFSAHPLIALYICIKFRDNSFNGFYVTLSPLFDCSFMVMF